MVTVTPLIFSTAQMMICGKRERLVSLYFWHPYIRISFFFIFWQSFVVPDTNSPEEMVQLNAIEAKYLKVYPTGKSEASNYLNVVFELYGCPNGEFRLEKHEKQENNTCNKFTG